ncbi:MAG: hypothetical protein VB875_07625, partial [Pirellulales bacterium]
MKDSTMCSCRRFFNHLILFVGLCGSSILLADEPVRVQPPLENLLATEKIDSDEVWVQAQIDAITAARVRVKVWFDEQFLGDGKAYRRRAKEFDGWRRNALRTKVVATLKALNDKSYN